MSVLTEDQRALQKLVRDFAETEAAPRAREADRTEQLPLDLLPRMAELGFFGGIIPTEWGGMGLDNVSYALVIEEMARVDHVLACLMSMPSALTGSALLRFGTDDQKERWLRPLAEGRMFGGAGVTEPRSGSDVAGMTTTYRRNGDRYVLNGTKAWISNLDIADFFITFATSDRSLGRKGISAFIVPRDTPGLGLHPFKDKLGFRALCTGELVLNEVELRADLLLGEEGQGFAAAMTAVERGRLGVAARAVGLAQACLDEAVSYARERVVFGHPISEFQLVQSKVTDMTVGVTTARLLLHHAAELLDRGERARVELSMAKMYASDLAQRAAADAVQIHGAYGCSSEYPVSRFYRDAKVFQIVEGSNDLHRALIGEYALGIRS